jgi:hypothetical protein
MFFISSHKKPFMKKVVFLFCLLLCCSLAFTQTIFLDAGKSVPTDAPQGQPVLSYSIGSNGTSQQMMIVLETGSATPALVNAVATGTVFKKMELDFYNEQGKLYSRISVSDVLLTAYQTLGDGTEVITLSYSKIKTK